MAFSIRNALFLGINRIEEIIVQARLKKSIKTGDITLEDANAQRGLAYTPRPAGQVVWIHTPSPIRIEDVSEICVAFADNPEVSFLFTVEQHLPEEKKDNIFLIPLDYPSFINNFLMHWKPDVLIWLSGDIRSVLIQQCKRKKIGLIYADADIPMIKKSKKYIIEPSIPQFLKYFDKIIAVSDEAAQKLRKAFVPRACLEVRGAIQSGTKELEYHEVERAHLAQHIANRPVWLAVYIHKNELVMVAKAHQRLMRSFHGALLLLYVQTDADAQSAFIRLEALGLRVYKCIDHGMPRLDSDVFITNDPNLLGALYSVSSVCFVGQSLNKNGGCDPYEAAVFGSAIIHGPSTYHYQNSYDRLDDVGGARCVVNSSELATVLPQVLSPDVAAQMAYAAWSVSTAGAEVNNRIIELLNEYLLIKEASDETA